MIEETTIVSQGTSSASVEVTTATQSNCDFRNTLVVVNGNSYELCFDIYHTEGGVRARIYADGYHNYSVPATINQWQTVCYDYLASATETIEVGLRFYDVSGSFDGNEIVYVDNFDIIVVLPVELTSFVAFGNKNSNVDLTWQTASEENNSHFEIEHSINGKDFTFVDKVNGVGTTSEIQNYSFTHRDAAAGKNYYRLRQVDFDGAFEYSSIEVVTVRNEVAVSVRPTMVSSSLQIILDEELQSETQIQLVDLTGRSLKSTILSPGATQYDIEVTQFEKGTYFIQLDMRGEIITRRFMKL